MVIEWSLPSVLMALTSEQLITLLNNFYYLFVIVIYLTSSCVILAIFGISGPV
jgi:hypothetical protein